MNELKNVLQFIVIISLCYIIYISYKYIKSIHRKNRLTEYSININNNKESDSLIFNLLFKTTSFIESLVIFNNLGRTYDCYIDKESRLKKGLDYISIKILTGTLLSIIYIAIIFLYKQEIDVTILLINFILGYVLPDFYCIYLSNKNRRITNHNILSTIIIMNNSYSIGRSTEQAIKDVIDRSEGIIKKEFIHIMNDIKLGMSTEEAFKKSARRTNNKTILEISNLLYSINKSGISPIEVFKKIEDKLLQQEKYNNEIKLLKRTNQITYIVFSLIPLLFIIYIMFIQLDLAILILNPVGKYIILILSLLYLLYCFIIWKIAKGESKWVTEK